MVRRFHGGAHGGRLVAVRGTAIVWIGLDGWLEALAALADRARASAEHYRRGDALYRSLETGDIRRCRNPATLQAAEAAFDRLRRPCGQSALTRPPSELGRPWAAALLVETRNQITRLAQGRTDGPRPKRPRFDPGALPDDRLAILMQRVGDPARRALLDAERRRRDASRRTRIPPRTG